MSAPLPWLARLSALLGRPAPPGLVPGRPRVRTANGTRQLYFDHRHIQSAMRLDDPDALVLPYTRVMTAFLLFAPEPAEILLVGLGGGSLAKFCLRYLPAARITAVEIDAEVIALRHQFQVPEDQRLSIVHADARDYLRESRRTFDVILLDGFDADGIAPSFEEPGFYSLAADRLAPFGVLAANLIGELDGWHSHFKALWAAFDRRVRLIPAPIEEDQYIALAFRDPALYRLPDDLEQRARALDPKIPLDFVRLAEWVQTDWHTGADLSEQPPSPSKARIRPPED